MDGIVEITEERFKSSIHIKMNNVIEGFDKFYNITLTLDHNISFDQKENKIINFIKTLYFSNSNSPSLFVDFYLTSLSQEEYSILLSKLDAHHRDILSKLRCENFSSVYFKIDNVELLEFFIKLSTRELFFITFYFTNPSITIWSNYNFNFLVFYDEHHTLDLLKDICETASIAYY